MKIIPAIDIIDGKCVRLTGGDYNLKTEYSSDPAQMARRFEAAGIKRLHLVDLDGAKQKQVVNWDVVEGICKATSLEVDFGGGVQSLAEVDRLFDLGVKQVTGGSIAVKNEPEFIRWIEKYGGDRIILGADVRDGRVSISGWMEQTDLDILDFIRKYHALGIREVICTDISRDGMLSGPSFELYDQILSNFPDLKLVASGGVSNLADLELLKSNGLYGAIVGKAYYEGKVTLEELALID
ncbi:MAG: 1-(5-phosphoribosyl)-5-[(5-phosphoribosylamino)methylideneamino]imidazole-4-carboxamide isomerase [Cyclobacteriaceae bacterium]